MIESSDPLRSYCRLLLRLSGAGGVSVYAPSPADGDRDGILLHEGILAPVPELADPAAAAAFHRRVRLDEPAPTRALSDSRDCRLIRIPLGVAERPQDRSCEDGEGEAGRRLGDSFADPRRIVWIGLRFEAGKCPFPSGSGAFSVPFEVREPAPGDWWNRILGLAADLAEYIRQVGGILADPVTGLPGRAEFQARLERAVATSRETGKPFTLMFVNPDDYASVNERFGREAGDQTIREVAARLRSTVRGTDHVAKYGGAIFTCLLIDTPVAQVQHVAKKIMHALAEASFHEGSIRLGFSIGAASSDQMGNDGPLDLIRRADQALNAAKRAGGGVFRVWKPGSEVEQAGNLDRLAGIFTGNMAKDYRNMVLLWDSVRLVASGSDYDDLAGRMVEQLHATLNTERVGIFIRTEQGTLEGVSGLTTEQGQRVANLEPTEQQSTLMARACEQGRSLREIASASGSPDGDLRHQACFAVPLKARETSIGCLYLDGAVSALRLDDADLVFIEALAAQMTVALDQARLAEKERQRQEAEQQQLRAELDDLRRAVQESKLAYRSEQMAELLATARRIAPTDATLLITGESGTGKEILARTIHELSSRRHRPLVVVDCGAISATLIDSELFGHEKGAFTGAQQRKIGRLAEADGATILLDEIGELPLDVQSKLLRFVQERQLTPVGSSRTRTVDVRILAATNVDLAARVADGRFRADLYHRLNVVRLNVPALRDRPEDILFLSDHFLRSYAAMYRKGVRELSPEARSLLLRYNWPGNVRELQNRLMQAVLLCESSVLHPAEFGGLSERVAQASAAGGTDAADAGASRDDTEPATTPALPEAAADAGVDSGSDLRPTGPLDRLRQVLRQQVDSATDGETLVALPLGKWLDEDLVLAAESAANGVSRRAAALLGIPETTLRRRLRAASTRQKAGLSPRPNTWDHVRECLAELVSAEELAGKNLLELAESLLLEELVARFPGDVKTTAALLGVTIPTARRRLAAC